MPLFNSLGSNYTKSFVLRSLLPRLPHHCGRLESELEAVYKPQRVVLTYKGRQAIFSALKALDLPKGGGVIVNGYTCYAVFQAIDAAGLTAVYVDPAERHLNFGSEELKEALKDNDNVVAVMIQNTLGYPVEIEAIQKICKKHKLPLIEDLAHSIGLTYPGGRVAGTVGDAAALSFSQDKAIDGVSGGALLWHRRKKFNIDVKRLDLFERWRDLIYPVLTWKIRTFHSVGVGRLIQRVARSLRLLSRPMDGRADIVQSLTPWHASLIRERFEKRNEIIGHRQTIAAVYQKRLPKDIQLTPLEGATYIRFPILVENRNSLISFLKKRGVHVSDIWYDAPVSPAKSLKLTNYDGECPNAEYLSAHMVNLPTHINVSREAAADIADGVNEWLSQQPR